MKVPLRDNIYLVDVARAKMPVRLVAYDAHGRVIGIQAPEACSAVAAQARPSRDERSASASSPRQPAPPPNFSSAPPAETDTATTSAPTSTSTPPVKTVSCPNPTWKQQALELGTNGNPAQFIEGHVRSNVATVKVKFADGGTMTTTPIDNFVLAVVPRQHLAKSSQVASATAYDTAGHRIGSESLLHPKPSGGP